jgi:5-methylthioribose kinase
MTSSLHLRHDVCTAKIKTGVQKPPFAGTDIHERSIKTSQNAKFITVSPTKRNNNKKRKTLTSAMAKYIISQMFLALNVFKPQFARVH